MDTLGAPDSEGPAADTVDHALAAHASNGDDVLDPETIDRIEELHTAVVRAEAEQRFGLLRGRRTHPPVDVQGAEQEFLARHGFATYNDFRLRIRRSTARPVGAAEAAPRERADVGPAIVAEPPAPSDRAESADEFRRRVQALRAAFEEDATELIAVQIEQVERQATLIVEEAAREAAEVVARATRAGEAVAAVAEGAARRTEHLVALTNDLPVRLDEARTRTAAMLRALDELAGRESPSGS